jgi:hypothetical protein
LLPLLPFDKPPRASQTNSQGWPKNRKLAQKFYRKPLLEACGWAKLWANPVNFTLQVFEDVPQSVIQVLLVAVGWSAIALDALHRMFCTEKNHL